MNSDTQKFQVLTERIARLERQNRHMKQAGLVLLFALISVFVMAQVKTAKAPLIKAVKSLEAGRFVLQDGQGRKRAELGLFSERPSLVFYDEAEKALMTAGLEPEGAGLALYDAAAQKVAALNCTATGPVFTLFTPAGSV
jgi:hypothetical protein